MPQRYGIRWNENQTSMLKQAVSKYNAAITRMIKSGKYDEVPNYTDYEKEKKRISRLGNRRFLYQRVKELGRILVKNKPDTLSPVTKIINGNEVVIPKYLDREIKNSKRIVNRRREELLKTIAPTFESLTKIEQFNLIANKNLAPIDINDEYYSGDDLEDLTSEKYFSWLTYADNYMNTLDSMSEWSDVRARIEHIILKLQDNQRALVEVFESKADEATIEYLYLSYKDHSQEFDKRKNNAVRFWEQVAQRYGID